MPLPYKNAVCRGSLWLGNGCQHCERCAEERENMCYAQNAEKSDTHQVATELDSQSAPSTIAGHVQGLPVAGYSKNVEQWKVDQVNENKRFEEKVLRLVDAHARLASAGDADGASVQIARRHIEDGFYRLNRAIMQPQRIEGDL
jgi:hypothetical protein